MPELDGEKRKQLIEVFRSELSTGRRFATITQARKLAGEIVREPILPGRPIAKVVEEAIEQSVLLAAKEIISSDADQSQIYDRLVDLYQRQPILGTRSSTSIELQQYSTTVPLAYLAGRLADITPSTTVYEPTAGRGALLMLADPVNVVANELDSSRAADLISQGYRTTQNDATSYHPDSLFDVVIANPPFGRRTGEQGTDRFEIGAGDKATTTSEIDQAIAWNSLSAMRDDGRAVLLIGGEIGAEKHRERKYNSVRARRFFFNLYSHYKVSQHFSIDGDLYRRQGGGYPVDIIVIEGRKPIPFLNPEVDRRMLPGADIPYVYSSYEELKQILPSQEKNNVRQPESIYSERPGMGTRRELGLASGADTRQDARDLDIGELPKTPGETDRSDGRSARRSDGPDLAGSGVGELRQDAQSGYQPVSSNEQRRDDSVPSSKLANSRKAQRGRKIPSSSPIRARDAGGGDRTSDRPDARRMDNQPHDVISSSKMAQPESNQSNSKSLSTQVPYEPRSQGKKLESFVPKNLESAIQSALDDFEAKYGDIDEYVTGALKFGSVENLHEALGAEQVDGVALALKSLQEGKATLIGDDTGLGKGRQMAAAIKYALETDRVPIFCTKDPGLYADIVRDLNDIGLHDIRPFMTNSNQRIPLPNGGVLRTSSADHKTELSAMLREGELSSSYNMVFTTYSQLQTVKGGTTDRRLFLESIVPQATLVLDEAHEASGSSNPWKKSDAAPDRAEFVRRLVRQADNVFFASATATKRAEVMDLYGARMSMADVTPVSSIQATLAKGGVPLQQVAIEMMARDGQYTRRARSCEGVEVGSRVVSTNHADTDQLGSIMRAIMTFDKAKQKAIYGLDKKVRASAKKAANDNSIGQSAVQSTNFSSIMWNVVAQAALARKADAVADLAINSLEEGECPFIGLSSTMGSALDRFVQEEEIKSGDEIDITFQDVLWHYLERSRDISIYDHEGVLEERRPMTDAELGEFAAQRYADAARLIDRANFKNMPFSPIDWIKFRIEDAGYSFGELTGRTTQLNYEADGTATYQRRDSGQTSKANKIEIINGFNSGKIDVCLGNRSAATGYSMHASTGFSNQDIRRFILAQPELDVNTFKQFMGRFHRTGQKQPPKISLVIGDTPDEKRPSAILAKKLASLNANTEAAVKGGLDFKDIPDYINEIGDEVVTDMLRDDPDLNDRLYNPIVIHEAKINPVEGAAAKVTGSLPILPIQEQEEFYDRLDVEYAATLERYAVMGCNPLEAASVDLDARTLASVELVSRAANVDSAFAEGIKAEVVDVKTQSRPKPTIEVINDIRRSLHMKPVRTVEDHDRSGAEGESDKLMGFYYEETVKLSEKYKEFKRAEYAQQESDPKKLEDKNKKLDRRVAGQLETLTRIKRFKPGQSVNISMGEGIDKKGFLGVVTEVRKRGSSIAALNAQGNITSNPAIPSQWHIVVAAASPQRSVVMPLSKVNLDSNVSGGFDVSLQATNLGGEDIYKLFDKYQPEERQVRTVLKGNLLRVADTSYQQSGDLIVGTTSSGESEPMLLMDVKFDLKRSLENAPVILHSADEIRRYFAATSGTRYVKTTDLKIILEAVTGGYKVSIAGKRKRLFNNESLKAAVGGEFISTKTRYGRDMVAYCDDAALEDVVYAISNELGKPLATFKNQEIAREITGAVAPEMHWSESVDSVVEREGLPPSVASVDDWEKVRKSLDKTFAVEGPSKPKRAQNSLRQPESSKAVLPGNNEDVASKGKQEESVDRSQIAPSQDGVRRIVEKKLSHSLIETGAVSDRDIYVWAVDQGYLKAQSPYDPIELTEKGKNWLSAQSSQMDLLAPKAEVETAIATEKQATTTEVPAKPVRSAITKPDTYRSRHKAERQVAQFLHEAGLAEKVTEDFFHLRIEKEPYQPLVIENLNSGDGPQIYLTHYREQNGDLIHDGEIVFNVHDDGRLTFDEAAVQNPFNGGEVRSYDRDFAEMFSMNVLDYGFAEAALKQQEERNTEATPMTVEEAQPPVETKNQPTTASVIALESQPPQPLSNSTESGKTEALPVESALGSPAPVSIKRNVLEKAQKAVLYLSNFRQEPGILLALADELKAKLAQSSQSSEIAIDPKLKSATENVLKKARNKQQGEFAGSIIQSAQKILDTAVQSGLARSNLTKDGTVTAFEGRNYSVRSRENNGSLELKVICHKTNGLVYAVDGEPKKIESLVARDRAVLKKYAGMSPQQMKQAVSASQKTAPRKGISV